MSIRTRIFGPGADEPLLRAKAPKGAKPEMLDSVAVPRRETRRSDGRGGDRHRLTAEQAILRHHDHEIVVEVVNLSSGGAMIRGELDLLLWDHVTLVLGDHGEMDCAVCWIKDDSAGLEFAHETCVDCAPDEHDELLRAVIRKSFPDADIALHRTKSEDVDASDAAQVVPRGAERHPLVWNGVVYYEDVYNVDAEPVRLRNISESGALVQSGNPLREGERVTLDMRATGQHSAVVKWTRGDQSGLQFEAPFDIQSLAYSRPEIASAETAPPADFGMQEPWAPGWRRRTLNQIARDLNR